MDNNLNAVLNFISAARKSRKYPARTAENLKYALRLIEDQITPEEHESTKLLLDNIDKIFHEYYAKNQARLSATSLEVYKSRVRKVLREFNEYGTNPAKMASWNPVLRTRKSKENSSMQVGGKANIETDFFAPGVSENTTRFELPLENNRKVVFLTPKDINQQEIFKMGKYLEFLKSIAPEEKIKIE